ncbi:hypothetical protein TWF694_010937 [Orbilia ellipsospora]|uniref:Chitinase n=1 Tax=Orbilia ellipsospora TaxID=2528407 RepID=A0AAV9X7I6_9PEZI
MSSLLNENSLHQWNSSNGAWLSHAYATSDTPLKRLPDILSFMRDNHVDYLFLNIGMVNENGTYPEGIKKFPRVGKFLNVVDAWEKSEGKRFKVFAWMGGELRPEEANHVDLNKPTKRAAIVNEAKKLALTDAEGSYIAEATREFDGVQLDLEPAGDPSPFEPMKSLMRELKAGIGGKLTSWAAAQLGEGNRYLWPAVRYHYMARYTDLICAMTYDTSSKNEADYRDYMKKATVDILQAVSGERWNNDHDHPRPTNGVKVLLGFPAFPANGNTHRVDAETIAAAAEGTLDAVREMSESDWSLGLLIGGSVYLYSDGTGDDGYSSQAKDWVEFREKWLGL